MQTKLKNKVGIWDSHIDRIEKIQKHTQRSVKELNNFFKKINKTKIADDTNKIYSCFHGHVESITQNNIAIVKLIHDLIEYLVSINQLNPENIKQSPQVDHTLGVLTGYELFRLKQYAKILDEDEATNKRIIYSIKRLEDGYLSRGYNIKDYTGDEFAIENNLKVVNRIEDPDLKEGQKIITRMIKPTIYYKDIVLKPGEVEIKAGTSKGK
jgi:hypothetical protein